MSDGTSLDISGMDEILSTIEYMGIEGKRVEGKALKKAANLINEEIKANAPTSAVPRQPKEKTQLWRTGKHAKTLLKISGVKSKNGQKFVLAGLQKNDNSKAFYLKFYEFGSSKTPANHFMSRAYQTKKDEAKEAIKEELRKALNLK